jgi:hypothetical protein
MVVVAVLGTIDTVRILLDGNSRGDGVLGSHCGSRGESGLRKEVAFPYIQGLGRKFTERKNSIENSTTKQDQEQLPGRWGERRVSRFIRSLGEQQASGWAEGSEMPARGAPRDDQEEKHEVVWVRSKMAGHVMGGCECLSDAITRFVEQQTAG